jgi:L-iditol 2-dehydrogenase
MRAALLVDVGRFELRAIPRPDLRSDEILVRIQAVGVCGTDLHIADGAANYNRDARGRLIPLIEQPQVLGHEIAGVVEEIGSDVAGLGVGDRVVVDQGRNCVSERRSPLCEYCSTGDSHQCDQYREHGITGLLGGFAEYLAIPAVNAVRVTSEIDSAAAALTEPLGCVIHACDALTRAPSRYSLSLPEQRARAVLILGAGPSGLLFVQVIRKVLQFRGTLLAVDPSPLKRRLAERFGAETIDPSAVDIVNHVAERTGGRRADVLVEASGSGSAFTLVPQVLRKQGTLVLYGHGHAGVDLSVMNAVQFLEPTLIAPTGASGGFDEDGRPTTYRRALRLIENGTIDVMPLITHRVHSLDAVPGVFGGAHSAPDYVKAVVVSS